MLGNLSEYSSYSWMNRVQSTSQLSGPKQISVVTSGSNVDQLEIPVRPVEQVNVVTAQASGNPYLLPDHQGTDPAEMAVRMRIRSMSDAEGNESNDVYGYGESKQVNEEKLERMEEYRKRIFGESEWIDEHEKTPIEEEEESRLKTEDAESDDKKEVSDEEEDEECQTCEKRKYQDGSDDPGVSFKIAGHIDPDAASATIRGHEMEHVTRNQAKAERENRKVVSQSVVLHNGICPECGRTYVSGGTTRTVTVAMNHDQESQNTQEQYPTFMGVA